jgi:hypothetical protein
MQEFKDRIRKGIKEYPNIPTIRTIRFIGEWSDLWCEYEFGLIFSGLIDNTNIELNKYLWKIKSRIVK